MSAAEFLTWAGGTVSGQIPANLWITVDRRQPGESFAVILQRLGVELRAGATKVVLLSDEDRVACVYAEDELPRLFRQDDDLTMLDILPGFKAPVRKFFE